jgi:sulfonate transport system substrate-binding protein
VLRDGQGINSGLSLIAASKEALDDPAKRAALRDVIGRLRQSSRWAQDHQADYARIFARNTKADIKLATLVVERQNPLLVAADASVTVPLQRIVDRFYADGELPAHVDVAAIVDPGIFPA